MCEVSWEQRKYTKQLEMEYWSLGDRWQTEKIKIKIFGMEMRSEDVNFTLR